MKKTRSNDNKSWNDIGWQGVRVVRRWGHTLGKDSKYIPLGTLNSVARFVSCANTLYALSKGHQSITEWLLDAITVYHPLFDSISLGLSISERQRSASELHDVLLTPWQANLFPVTWKPRPINSCLLPSFGSQL